MTFISERVENIVGNGEMLVTGIFSFPHIVFKRLHYLECLNLVLFSKELTFEIV